MIVKGIKNYHGSFFAIPYLRPALCPHILIPQEQKKSELLFLYSRNVFNKIRFFSSWFPSKSKIFCHSGPSKFKWLHRHRKTFMFLIFISVFIYCINTPQLGPLGFLFVVYSIKAAPGFILLWVRHIIFKYRHLPVLRWAADRLEESGAVLAVSQPLIFSKLLPDKFKANLQFHKLPPPPQTICLGSRSELVVYKEPLPLVKYGSYRRLGQTTAK